MNKYILLAAIILMTGNQNTALCYSKGNHTQNENRSKKATKNPPKENIDAVENRFNDLIRQIAASKTDDENTRLARAHVKRLDEIEKLKREKKYYDRKAKESSQRTHKREYSIRYNLDDEVLKVAKEQGYTIMEAARMTRSQKPKDKAIVQRWISIATKRLK